ncbi:hypothetical protein CHS0354_007118 [Potamilus streckersoni]|uniref:CUB domain-containing protein n=1 Tax=Potamilus streckersoni TaxID=2493646 RepID=A0AAE0W5Z3_9BIVA|nr:hypothetical protein CHS0354_007118 [Potamilus streckersoni]
MPSPQCHPHNAIPTTSKLKTVCFQQLQHRRLCSRCESFPAMFCPTRSSKTSSCKMDDNIADNLFFPLQWYDCTYTISGGISTDKVIIWIQNSDVQNNGYTYLYIYDTENAPGTVTISSNGYVNNYYYRSSPLTFRFYAANWSNNTGGYRIRYKYNRVGE